MTILSNQHKAGNKKGKKNIWKKRTINKKILHLDKTKADTEINPVTYQPMCTALYKFNTAISKKRKYK